MKIIDRLLLAMVRGWFQYFGAFVLGLILLNLAFWCLVIVTLIKFVF